MILPLTIEADAAGEPILYAGDYYVVNDGEKREAFRAFIDSKVGCVGTVQKLRQIVRAVNAAGPAGPPALDVDRLKLIVGDLNHQRKTMDYTVDELVATVKAAAHAGT